MNNDFIISIFNTIFYGFCFTSLISYFLSLSKSENIKLLNENFFKQSIKCIRVFGIIYLIYTLSYSIYYFNFVISKEDYLSTKNRATGSYALAYWFMLLRPIVFSLLTQLLWLKIFLKKSFANFILTFIIFIVVLFSGANIERFIILITSLHRDYLPSSWKLYDPSDLWHLIPLSIFAFFIVRIVIYSFLIFIFQLVTKKFSKPKL